MLKFISFVRNSLYFTVDVRKKNRYNTEPLILCEMGFYVSVLYIVTSLLPTLKIETILYFLSNPNNGSSVIFYTHCEWEND